MFTIGEFSRITGLTIKALRFYHDEGLLLPAHVDPQTGYRYYDASKLDRALAIAALRRLEFSLQQIADMIRDCQDDADLLDHLQTHRRWAAGEAKRYDELGRRLDQLISQQREAKKAMQDNGQDIIEKTVDAQWIAGIRTKGRYRDCGSLFGQLARKLGRHIAGPPLLLCYDDEYREEDADYEAAMPIRKPLSIDGASVRELPGGRCVTLLHRGPYEELGRSYAKILQVIHDRGLEVEHPCREVYLKGPGMIFRGNPKKYLTELQFIVRSKDGIAKPS